MMKNSIKPKRKANNDGFSLLECMLGIAIMALLLGSVAQGLLSHYCLVQMEHDRVAAAQAIQTVINDIRIARDENADDFPEAVVEAFESEMEVEGAPPEATLTVAFADAAANPLQVTVLCEWKTLQGRTARETMGFLLSDQ